MFRKVLIANRGEIACRIIRACREIGLKTVAIRSEVDENCLHVKLADESVCVGPGPVLDSYLNIPSIISAAEITGADAIHPGYGFLAENTYFAEVCESCGIKFIGPSKDSISRMGDKIAARKLMKKSGIPIVPGTEEPVEVNSPNLPKIARKIGYPLIVKAAAGGGGKGMRLVRDESELIPAISVAQSEAKIAFGNPAVYLEKYIEEPRHIEFQIMGDVKGKVIYLPERDCSIQRRHQKLLEESPSVFIGESLRKKMGRAAVRAGEAIDYVTVGTVEFLVDKKKNFYFMEMNTRIQVEHPVTEMVTGLDLIKEQIRLAAGERISLDSDDISIRGAAIECRINAEDPEKDFLPSPGKIEQFIIPGGPGIRVDTHGYAGYIIPSFYDSLLAKIISMGENRAEAVRKMQRALREFIIEGIKTTIPLHQKILDNEDFLKGEVFTNFLHKHILGETNAKQ